MPAQRAATTEPENKAPSSIDVELGGPFFKEVNHCEKCAKGCWRCAPGEFRPPDLSKVRQVCAPDAEVHDALMLITWRKLFVASCKTNRPSVMQLFDWPLIVDGKEVPDSILSERTPYAMISWGRYRMAVNQVYADPAPWCSGGPGWDGA